MVHDAAAFQHSVELISLKVLDRLDFTGRPFDFERIDLGRIVQTKVHAKIVVGQIAAPTEDLGCLRHPSSDEFQPRTKPIIDVPVRCLESLRDPAFKLFFTEGKKKVCTLASQAFCAVDLWGVHSWYTNPEHGGFATIQEIPD